jgi:hypothetical protein
MFFWSHPKDSPIQLPFRTGKGILTRIFTGCICPVQFPTFIFAPRKKYRGSILSLLSPSLRPSSYLLNFSSEIDVVDKKRSFKLGLVDQGHIGKFMVTQSKEKKNTILTFLNITVKDIDMRSSETY